MIHQRILVQFADITTTEPQGTGRKLGRSDPEGADSKPGKVSVNFSSSFPTFTRLIIIVHHVH